jgi:hypothetical protein
MPYAVISSIFKQGPIVLTDNATCKSYDFMIHVVRDYKGELPRQLKQFGEKGLTIGSEVYYGVDSEDKIGWVESVSVAPHK